MIYFTVFTPTYNRAYILPQLYKSLLTQTNQNFEWLVIDDGSTDNTEELIGSYIQENRIPITYIKQKNQGKHIAINKSLDIATTEYIITIDSDDYLLENAIEICSKTISSYSNNDDLAGFSFINYLGKDSISLGEYGKKKSLNYKEITLNIKGEKSFVLKKSIAKQFKFPVFEDEKFCQESYMLVQIMENYQILYTDYILARGEYLEDGLSQNIYKRMLKNPKYALSTLKIKYLSSLFSKKEKDSFAINFWDITLKTKVVHPLYQLFHFPLQGTFIYLRYKLFG
ncbi:glycosyltransferase family 2 protein [Empedobacter brevis]